MSKSLYSVFGRRCARALSWLALVVALPVAAQVTPGETYTGRGTNYGYSGGGNCSLPFPEQVLTVAINDADYQGSQACGAYLEVLNPATSKKVVVRVDNRCPDCPPRGLDLAIPAFAQIAPLEAGIVSLRWRYVSGPDAQASVVFKEGSSASWSALQVRNQRNAVASLAYRTTGSGGTYVPLERQMYNYFVAPGGMGPGPFDLKVTDVFGQVLEVSGVPLSVGPELPLGVQFPAVLPAPGSAWSVPDSTPPAPATGPVTYATSVNSDWGQGYCLNVMVTNPNAGPVDWAVRIPVAGTVYNAWDSQVTQAGNELLAQGAAWNRTLQPGASLQFGFCANR
ncbi:expansin EXLX1 family cellulose-binding protein [Paracidovorax oryzae]|uniref:expansin EXLX1 family cellulose-binding protein n=1 Tax=Paracidovorax oryzae TaxID=862720 RepID=UPI0035CF78F5